MPRSTDFVSNVFEKQWVELWFWSLSNDSEPNQTSMTELFTKIVDIYKWRMLVYRLICTFVTSRYISNKSVGQKNPKKQKNKEKNKKKKQKKKDMGNICH